jgi:hypothetical protein
VWTTVLENDHIWCVVVPRVYFSFRGLRRVMALAHDGFRADWTRYLRGSSGLFGENSMYIATRNACHGIVFNLRHPHLVNARVPFESSHGPGANLIRSVSNHQPSTVPEGNRARITRDLSRSN